MARRPMILMAAVWLTLALVAAYLPAALAGNPPEVVIDDPIMGQTVSGVYLVTGRARDSDGEVVSVQIHVDSGEFFNVTDTSGNGSFYTWSWEWNTTLYDNGWHALGVIAHDNNGQAGDYRIEVQVSNGAHNENTPPWVEIVKPLSESTVCGIVHVLGEAGDHDVNDSVEMVQVRFREGEWFNATPLGTNGSFSAWRYDLNTTRYDNGFGRIDARSWDGEAYSVIFDRWVKVSNPCPDGDGNHRPWVHIDHPLHGSTVHGIVVISGRAGDPDEPRDHVEKVLVRIGRDGAWTLAVPLGPVDNPWRSWALEWDTRVYDNGWIAICAKSFDGDLYSEMHCVEVNVHNGERENHRPIVHILYPTNGQTVHGFVNIKGSAEDPDEPGDRVEKVEVRINDRDWRLATDMSGDGTWHYWKIGWNTEEFDNGEYRLCARSFDGDLYSELSCIEVIVHNEHKENQPPRVDITEPPSGSTVHGDVIIRGLAGDDNAVKYVEWRINDGIWRDAFDTSGDHSWSTWKAVWHTLEFDDRCYVISARAFDGSLYSEIDKIELCVDNHPGTEDHPPVVHITSPECEMYVDGIVVIHGTSEDDHEVVKVQVKIDGGEWHLATAAGTDRDPWANWTFEWDTRNYDNGLHTVYARALDNAGQYSEVAHCAYRVHNSPDGASPPPGPKVTGGILLPISSMGLVGFFGAGLVRRRLLGSVL